MLHMKMVCLLYAIANVLNILLGFYNTEIYKQANNNKDNQKINRC